MILVEEFGQQTWIMQAMDAVKEAVQNCIDNLSGTVAPVTNAQPLGQGGQYLFNARTAPEIRATADAAAHQGQVSQARSGQLEKVGQADQALADGKTDVYAMLQQQAGMQDPASQGAPPTEDADVSGSDGWIV